MTSEEDPVDLDQVLSRGLDAAHADVRARASVLADVVKGARRRRRRQRVVLALSVALAVTAASVAGVVSRHDDGKAPEVLAGPVTAPAPTSASPQVQDVPYDDETAPAAFRDREPLPSCGSYVLGQGEQLEAGAGDCLANALRSQRGAELALSRVTVEGAPVVEYYRALPGTPGVELFIDATRDNNGSQSWGRTLCTGFEPVRVSATGCSDFEGLAPTVTVSAEQQELAQALIRDLRAFAAAPDADTLSALPLSPVVQLGLGVGPLRPVNAEALVQPSAWVLEPGPRGYAGSLGPFDVLQVLRRAETYAVVVGSHPHCASPARPAPDAGAGLLRVSTQPASISSCLQWSTVDLFVRDGVIEAITLDLWEP